MQLPRLLSLAVAAAGLLAPLSAQDLYEESVVRTFELTFHQTNWWQLLEQNYAAKIYIKADLKVGDITYKDVGVRFRGNSSYTAIGTSQKKPFKISMDEFVPGQRLLGYETLNLNNSFRDPTFTREVLCYWIYRQLMPACKANYVRLVINNESWGPYVNVQQINQDMLSEWFPTGDGNRYRGERQTGTSVNQSALIWLGTNLVEYQKGYEVKNPTPVLPWEDIRDVCNVLNNTAAPQLPVELPKVFDIEEALRYSVGQVVVPAVDSYLGNGAHNFYLFNEGFHGRMAILPWDLNASFGGNAWLTVQEKVQLSPFYQETNVGRPMLNRTLSYAPWRQRFLAHVRTMLDTVYDWRVLGARIATLQKLVEADLQADNKKLYSMQLFHDNVVQDVQLFISSRWQWIPGLKPLVEGRTAFLRGHVDVARPAPALAQISHLPVRPTMQDDVTVTVKATATVTLGPVFLYWRVQGPWQTSPMFDDGQHGDGQANDGVYGAHIPKQRYGTLVEYYAGGETAAAQGGAMTFEPRAADHTPVRYRVQWPTRSFPVRLNELLALNSNGIRDEKGEREDWIELFNRDTQALSVSGLYLTDDLAVPTKWQIPAGHSIPPGGVLLIWADDEPLDGPLHATFKLSGDGEELALFDRDGITLLDEVAFGPQLADVSTGRLYDGIEPWVTYPLSATPGMPNVPVTCGYRHYSALAPLTHRIALLGSGLTRIAGPATWQLGGGPPSSLFAVFFAGSGADLPLPGFGVSFLLGPPLLGLALFPSNASGGGTVMFPIPDDPRLVGLPLYGQAFALDAGGWQAANALEMRFCPK